ncbi:MAG: MOSC domain-containing protein [bacterium]
MDAKVFSINISEKKGTFKIPIKEGIFEKNEGLLNDAHKGKGDRQVSLLALEDIKKINACPKIKNNPIDTIEPGNFAENITTIGIDLSSLEIGTCLKIGDEVILKISKIGKECHRYCSIYYKIGDCIMPKKGIFGQVIEKGEIKVGDKIEIIEI